MSKRLIHRFTWKHVYNRDAYLYGTSLDFTEDGALFENVRMASGKLISRFYSSTNYQGQRSSPVLPLLIPGQAYWIEVDIDAWPEGRYFLEFAYYNRQGEQIGFEILRQNQGEITYPHQAFTYIVTLKSAGAGRLLVRGISIYSLKEIKPLKLDSPLEKRYQDEQIPADLHFVRNLIKKD